jgi:uncharacterized phage-like protein YoqJ
MASENIKTCCFTGHRPKALPWKNDETDLRCISCKSKIKFTLETLIVEDGYERFISGMAMGADTICAQIALSLKILYPHIKLLCAVPNYAFTEGWADENIRKFRDILDHADEVKYISGNTEYNRRDFMKRNIYMVDSSELVIAVYKEGESGGTKNTVDYARSKNKKVIIIEP